VDVFTRCDDTMPWRACQFPTQANNRRIVHGCFDPRAPLHQRPCGRALPLTLPAGGAARPQTPCNSFCRTI